MKKGNTFLILLASFSIVALFVLSVVLTFYMASDSSGPDIRLQDPAVQSQAQVGKTQKAPSADTPKTEKETFSTEAVIPEHDGLILAGDSRTVAMQEAVNDVMEDPCTYIAKSGEGYSWFLDYGLTSLELSMKEHPKENVVLNLGVNDLKNLDLYISLYQTLMKEYPSTSFYFLSVNPVDESYKLNVSNQEIYDFNEALKSAFPEQYVDGYGYLEEQGYQTVDGLHYTKETSRKLHKFLIEQFAES